MKLQLHYQPTLMAPPGKEGKLVCGADGYYDINAGAFDTFNSAGAWYGWDTAKPFFDSSSHFMRRVGNRALFGEDGHPIRQPGQTMDEWIVRVLTIHPDRRSHHIKELYVDDKAYRNEDGSPMFAVFLRLKPMGARAQVCADFLENPSVNAAFSIRTLTQDVYDQQRGHVVKIMKEVVTFDLVDEPGIKIATKYNNPSLEAMNLSPGDVFTEAHLRGAIRYLNESGVSMESASIVTSLENLLVRNAGVVPAYAARDVLEGKYKVPAYSKWV